MTFTPPQNLLSGAQPEGDDERPRQRRQRWNAGPTPTSSAVSATNTDDPPTTLVPGGVGTYAGQPRELSLANLNQISVNDVDEPDLQQHDRDRARGHATARSRSTRSPA